MRLTDNQRRLAAENVALAYKIAHVFVAGHTDAAFELEEFEAEALYDLTRAAGAYKPESGVKFSTYAWSWIYYALRRVYTEVLEGRKRFKFVREGYDVAEPETPEPPSVEIPLRCLPQPDRFVVETCYYGGKSKRYVADTLGVSPTRVGQIHRRALRRLHKVMRSF